jgi:tetratricopeptide (TPR) repeat protein
MIILLTQFEYMSEDFDPISEEEMNDLMAKFFQMKDFGSPIYFDSDEFEALIDYFFEEGEAEHIEYLLQLALEQHPGNHDFLLRKAQYHAINGQDELGLDILNQLNGLATDPDYFMIKGTLLSNLQKYREAIEEYTNALNQGQDLEEVYSNIAFEYENLEQYDKAIEYLNKVLDINPDNESALNEIGLCFEMGDDSSRAIQFFNDFIDQHPYSRSAWFNLAISYNSIGKSSQAIDAYEFSLAIDDDQPSAYFNIANIYAGLENHPRAIDYYRRTLIKESPDAITYYYMGESYEKMDRFDDALNAYTNSYNINKSFHEALIGMSRCYFVIGDEEEAFKKLEDAIKLEEPFPLFWSIRSLKLDELGFFKLAKRALTRLIFHQPNEIVFALSLAVLYNSHDAEYSIKIIDDALIKFINNEEQALGMFLKGLYLMKLGQDKEGIFNIESAIELDKEEFNNPLIQSEINNHNYPLVKKIAKKHQL